MNCDEIRCPVYSVKDTILFNREEQEGDSIVFDDEGDLVGTIHLVEILIEKDEQIVRYWTQHDDWILEESVIERMIPESKALNATWLLQKSSQANKRKWKGYPKCISCDSDREDYLMYHAQVDDLIPQKYHIGIMQCAECKTPKRVALSVKYKGVGYMWTGYQTVSYNESFKGKKKSKADKIRNQLFAEKHTMHSSLKKIETLETELKQYK